LKPKQTKGIMYLDIPSPSNENSWERITDPVEIEQKLLGRHKLHFGQAKTHHLQTTT
jgi:hypothetical protein